MLVYTILVTGPPYGTQNASSALCFARALLAEGHEINSVFFYREGVLNGNRFFTPATDEYDLVRDWVAFHQDNDVSLHICTSAALRRGVLDAQEIDDREMAAAGEGVMNQASLQPGFLLSGLGALVEALSVSDRTVQF